MHGTGYPLAFWTTQNARKRRLLIRLLAYRLLNMGTGIPVCDLWLWEGTRVPRAPCGCPLLHRSRACVIYTTMLTQCWFFQVLVQSIPLIPWDHMSGKPAEQRVQLNPSSSHSSTTRLVSYDHDANSMQYLTRSFPELDPLRSSRSIVQIYFKNQTEAAGQTHPTHLPLSDVLAIVTDSFTSATERHIEVRLLLLLHNATLPLLLARSASPACFCPRIFLPRTHAYLYSLPRSATVSKSLWWWRRAKAPKGSSPSATCRR